VTTLDVEGVDVKVGGRHVLRDVNLTLLPGECLAVMGPSGVGKTSLLNCIAGIAVPASGSIVVDGAELTTMSRQRRTTFRLTRIGMVFQFGELLPELTVAANVALPSRLMGMPPAAALERAIAHLDRFGLAERADAHPHELSGGEQQLVGIARALAHEPALVLADEPTGMLDEENTTRVVARLILASRALSAGSIIVTHDRQVASQADRVLVVAGGSVIDSPEVSVAGHPL
jgi:putative ABC transport system ATP-binding protein